MGAAIGIAVVLLVVGLAGGYFLYPAFNKTSSSSQTQITETGSSLLFPLMQKWGPNYTLYNPNVVLTPASTGSGTGQSYAEQGLINIGGSDGYLANASATSLINVPVAISAQLVWYNLAGISGHLNLNGSVLAQIYEGSITNWSNNLIVAANPTQASALDHLNGTAENTITVVKRADSSGDTFLFTSLCYMSWSGWTYSYSTSALSGLTGSHVLPETGNSGMVTGVEGQTGAIAYIGISYTPSGTGINYAALGDNASLSASGGTSAANYVLPTAGNISQDANLALTRLTPTAFSATQLAISLILGGSYAGVITLVKGGGGSNPTAASPTPYPDANLEYTLIKTAASGNTVTSGALSATVLFLQWAISYGNYAAGGAESAYLAAVHFIPLTPTVVGYDQQELATVAV